MQGSRVRGVRVMSLLLVLAGFVFGAVPAPFCTAGSRMQNGSTAPVALERRGETRLSAGTFLVASRGMRDPRFLQSVILMVQHDRSGSAGIVINRPSEMRVEHLFPGRETKLGDERFVFQGGPVAMQDMIGLLRLHQGVAGAKRVFGSVYLTTSRHSLEQVIDRRLADDRFRVYAGYAGWASGQLEAEIAHGQWKVMPADAIHVFDTPPDEIWTDLMRDSEAGRISI